VQNRSEQIKAITESSRFGEATRLKISPAVEKALRDSNDYLPASEKREQNIELLADGKAVCVVTGQQVGLFLGPAFTLYKAITAVRLAEAIEEETQQKCVPVFWLQTEDHDLAEISRVSILSREVEQEELIINTKLAASSSSVAYSVIGTEIEEQLAILEQTLGFYPDASSVLEACRKWYSEGRTMHEAFAGLLCEILSDSGLVFLNPRQEILLSESKSVIRTAIEKHVPVAQALLEQGEAIKNAGGDVQVHVRENSPLPFIHPKSGTGDRFRFQQSGETWTIIGGADETIFSTSQILELLEAHPEQFSTSALLRPFVQDSLLPSVAYVGGNAERNYFKQIAPLSKILGVRLAPFVSRASFVVLDQKFKDWLADLSLELEDLDLKESDLARKIADTIRGTALGPSELEKLTDKSLTELFSNIENAFQVVDKTLLSSLEKSRGKVDGLLERLFQRYSSAYLRNAETATSRLAKLQVALRPAGVPQERVYTAISLLCRHGSSYLEAVSEEVAQFNPDEKVITL